MRTIFLIVQIALWIIVNLSSFVMIVQAFRKIDIRVWHLICHHLACVLLFAILCVS